MFGPRHGKKFYKPSSFYLQVSARRGTGRTLPRARSSASPRFLIQSINCWEAKSRSTTIAKSRSTAGNRGNVCAAIRRGAYSSSFSKSSSNTQTLRHFELLTDIGMKLAEKPADCAIATIAPPLSRMKKLPIARRPASQLRRLKQFQQRLRPRLCTRENPRAAPRLGAARDAARGPWSMSRRRTAVRSLTRRRRTKTFYPDDKPRKLSALCARLSFKFSISPGSRLWRISPFSLANGLSTGTGVGETCQRPANEPIESFRGERQIDRFDKPFAGQEMRAAGAPSRDDNRACRPKSAAMAESWESCRNHANAPTLRSNRLPGKDPGGWSAASL